MTSFPQWLKDWPGLAFALTGGIFSLLYVSIRPIDGFASFFGMDHPVIFAILLVGGSSASAFLVGTLLWNQFESDIYTYPHRPALLGSLVGIFSLPPTLLIITFSRYLFTGLPEDLVFRSPSPGMTQWTPIGDLILQDIWVALFASIYGLIFTAGLPIIVGAATGEALRRFSGNTETA